jgi:triosephosphate isomerase (TIM)
MRKLVVGNWKMNGSSADLAEIALIGEAVKRYPAVDSGLCLPATLIDRAARMLPDMAIGGQDCHMAASGAHTGCVSALMLADAGARMTIVGHSERRAGQHESDADVRAKAGAARAAGLSVIVCVGETLEERDAGDALHVVLGQLRASLPDDSDAGWLSIAYEPIWAIGTGRVAAAADVAEMHNAIRAQLNERFGARGALFRILYGGSMNGDNAAALFDIPNVDGGLIGGASLSAARFEPILAAAV